MTRARTYTGDDQSPLAFAKRVYTDEFPSALREEFKFDALMPFKNTKAWDVSQYPGMLYGSIAHEPSNHLSQFIFERRVLGKHLMHNPSGDLDMCRVHISSFGEMYSSLAGHAVENIFVADDGTTILSLSGGMDCRFTGARVEFGSSVEPNPNPLAVSTCRKNIEGEPCTLEFIKKTVMGTRITSAGDFGDYIEFGLDQRFNLGLHLGGFHVISTESPVDHHRL